MDSTAEEVEAAKTAVANAQAAADKAKTDAATAQSTADTAKTNASNAQKAADTAKTAADNAKKAADDAQKAADKAQDDVNALTKRVVNAETSIKQNSEAIELRATKKEVTEAANATLKSAKTYADAQIKVTADSINQNVTKKFDNLQIGGRNYAVGTSNEWSEYWIPSTGVNICRDVTKIVVPDTFKKGDVFTTSIEIEWSGFKSSEGTFRLWSQGSSDGTWDKLNPFASRLAEIRTESGSWLFKVTNTWDGKATNYIVGFRCDYSSGTGKIRWRRLKAEAGNKATDWTPAPEDLATADNVNDKLTELRQEVSSNIEQTGEAIKSSVYEKVYMKDDVDSLLSSVNTEVEQTKTSWQVTFNQLVKQLNDYSDGSDAAFDEIRKYIRFEDGNILLGNSSSPLILRIRNDRIQFLQNGYEVAYISDQRMYNTTCEIINQLRIADSAWTVETNINGDTIVSLIGL